jgi:prolipoprotein diacylglyceryltransferase
VVLGTFQPTFLYESIWCLVVAATIVWAERRFGLANGQVFALYGMLYTAGRGVIEMLRTDEANHILGLRLNVWTSVIVFLGALYGFWRAGRRALPGDVGQESADDTAAPASQ